MLLSFCRLVTPFFILGLVGFSFYMAINLIRANLNSGASRTGFNLGLALLLLFSLLTLRLWPSFLPLNVYDDEDYLAHATAFVYGNFPSYDREFIRGWGRFQPIGAPGTGIMAAPFAAIGAVFDRINEDSVTGQRLESNRQGTATHFGFTVSTVVWVTLAVFLLATMLSRIYSAPVVFISLLSAVFLIGLPIFVWRRPVFSHGYEFFLQSLWVCWLVKRLATPAEQQPLTIKFLVGLGALAALTGLTRYNNLSYALLWPLLIMGAANGSGFINMLKQAGLARIGLVYIIFGVLVFWFVVLPDFFNPPDQPGPASAGYEATVGRALSQIHSPLVYLKRIWHILAGPDMGLIFTAPALVLGLWALIRKQSGRMRFYLWALLAAGLPIFFLVMMWGSYGSSYGYRYLVYSLSPILIFPLADLLEKWRLKKHKLLTAFFCLWLTFPFLSQMFFQSVLIYQPVPNWFADDGALTMGREFFQMEIYEQAVTDPALFLKNLTKTPKSFYVYIYTSFKDGGDLTTEMRYILLFLMPIFIWKLLPAGLRLKNNSN